MLKGPNIGRAALVKLSKNYTRKEIARFVGISPATQKRIIADFNYLENRARKSTLIKINPVIQDYDIIQRAKTREEINLENIGEFGQFHAAIGDKVFFTEKMKLSKPDLRRLSDKKIMNTLDNRIIKSSYQSAAIVMKDKDGKIIGYVPTVNFEKDNKKGFQEAIIQARGKAAKTLEGRRRAYLLRGRNAKDIASVELVITGIERGLE